MKLKFRLALAMVGSTAVALAACFAAVYGLVLNDETRDLDASLMAEAQVAELASAPPGDGERVVVGDHVALPEAYGDSPAFVAAYDAQGRVLSATKSFVDGPPMLQALRVKLPVPASGATVDFMQNGAKLRGVVVPIGGHGESLLFASSRESIDDDTAFLLRTLSVLFVTAVVLSGFAAIWLGQRLARDVDGIAVVATAVARGDLNARVAKHRWGSVETRALADALNHMIDQLAELVEGQRVFISHAAHELRSPLATMRGELQLALRRPREAAEYRKTCENVLAEAQALTNLADDLLTLARIKDGEVRRGATARVGGIVEDALRMARGVAAQRGVFIEEPGADWPVMEMEVRGQRTDLARALRNLVDNAVVHSPQGGTVHVLAGKSGTDVRFAVIDSGPGVSGAEKSSIFQAFYRGSRECAGDDGGTGLGLAIARGIARSCGGDLTLDTEFALGAKFDLVVPLSAVGGQDGGGGDQRDQ